ncbi:hypothetical protein RHOFW104T7_13160 [Rhodanobacter thiooxydans]|uniref:Phage tail protein n=1 Tax=Rhodanobacter thiooxydans TaxID=416169 RepID=A0A154QH68_9GAMM|nr:hypothetical protein RHOFW104T7_13160 [Rhodanobacter thiooxydans]
MIPGASINFGGTDYIVPPINLRVAYGMEEQIKTICKPEGEVDFADYVLAASAILFALMQRNYPDLSRDSFNDLIDLPMLRPIMAGMLQISGYAARPLVPATSPEVIPSPEASSSDSSTAPPDGSPETSSNA